MLKERSYRSGGGDDEANICGFVRLRRIHRDERIHTSFPELSGAALVRELHVYGQTLRVGDKRKQKGRGRRGYCRVAGEGLLRGRGAFAEWRSSPALERAAMASDA